MILNAILLALREMRRNVMRSFLTVLGIVIGVAAVITMVTVGNGATAKVTADIAKLGSNLLIVIPGQHQGPGSGSESATPFKIEDAQAIEREIGSIKAVSPTASKSASAVFGNKNWSTAVTGADNAYLDIREWQIKEGRKFTDAELHSGKTVCLLGASVVKELFGTESPVGKKIRLQKISFDVIGVLLAKGQSGMGRDQDDTVIIPLRTLQRRMAGNQDVSQIQVSVEDGASTEVAQAAIEQLFRERRNISSSKEDDFSVRDMKEIAETLTGITKVLTALLGGVAAVSLLVGGIGIMNIMLVSVTERTREIGTRLAIGALERDVLTQFLVEAVVLSSFGGLIGILLALGVSAIFAHFLQVPLIFQAGIILIAFLFSSAVGVIFGYFPARKAASLDPIDALRYE